ncbi:MAG TPA: hypothetical protein VL866_18190, partial [Pyrinomonadaceae bacterium]|nr:hypothetical protein [Pyrinomonadaceae bacterium]
LTSLIVGNLIVGSLASYQAIKRPPIKCFLTGEKFGSGGLNLKEVALTESGYVLKYDVRSYDRNNLEDTGVHALPPALIAYKTIAKHRA